MCRSVAPLPNYVKINVDGAFNKESLSAGVGIIGDSSGQVVNGISKEIKASSALMSWEWKWSKIMLWLNRTVQVWLAG